MNTEIDWSTVKFRASSWGALMTDPKSAEDKKAGKLGETCKGELIKIYNLVKYGRRKEIITAAMDKGKLVEKDSIAMYSYLEGVEYFKNEYQLENEWFTGHPDVYSGVDIYNADTVDDMKNSWELDSFTPWLDAKPDKAGVHQLNVYYSLTGAKSGALVRALMDCPPEVLEGEKYYLLRKMNVISDDSPEYKVAERELVRNLTFPDIPIQERLIKIPVDRDDELIQKMKDKVPIFRQWLEDFEKKHLSLYKTQLV
jgi:hypothetical protein